MKLKAYNAHEIENFWFDKSPTNQKFFVIVCTSKLEHMDSLKSYINEVDSIALKLYGIGWEDIASNEDELDQCRLQGETPEEYVLRVGEKHGLTRIH